MSKLLPTGSPTYLFQVGSIGIHLRQVPATGDALIQIGPRHDFAIK